MLWMSDIAPQWKSQAVWDELTPVQRWRWLKSSMIAGELGMARTSYLTRFPHEARKRAQRRLAAIRSTRPALHKEG